MSRKGARCENNYLHSLLSKGMCPYPLNMSSIFGFLMALWQGKSRRSKTGRRIRYERAKRKFEIGREQHLTTIGEQKLKIVRTTGNNRKTRLLTANVAYVLDPKTQKTTKTEIISVIENAANIHYIRRNIINKGAIIETKLGKAKITSRSGQTGNINAVLLSK
jgi:small subunit ribosomal protein S8e